LYLLPQAFVAERGIGKKSLRLVSQYHPRGQTYMIGLANAWGWGSCAAVYYRFQKECSTLLGSDNALKRTSSDIKGVLLVCAVWLTDM
jgi:hypothetical protein